ncbi:apolipoprotein N-acyltransferase [Ahrensia sp. R2A130]|nr:apolipoprotein N-acyltransferase [Ahrensia sp. R2A130]
MANTTSAGPITAFLERLAGAIILLHGWRGALVTLLAGAATALSLAPLHISPVLFLTLPILIWRLDGSLPAPRKDGALPGTMAKAMAFFRTGWLFGFGYHLAGLYWIGAAFLVDAGEFAIFLPFAVVALPAGLAIFTGLGCALARMAWEPGWRRIAMLAATLTLAEMARGMLFTGFPWNLFGYAIMPTPMLMQTASLFGAYGVTWLALAIGGALALFSPEPMRRGPWLAVTVALIATHVGFGAYRLGTSETTTVEGVNIRIVQPAIAQEEKWLGTNEDEIMARYLDLTNANRGPKASSAADFTHIIWPESAFPFILTQRADRLSQIANALPDTTTLITGAMRVDESVESPSGGPAVFNAVYAIDGSGQILAARDKTHLVPFGEYLPFQNVLESIGLRQLTNLPGGFAQGQERSFIDLPDAPTLLALICYEIIFPGNALPAAQERPGWIVNVTNDAWYGQTAGPYQHLHQTRVRAVEEGIPVVRAANSGISMMIDAYGSSRGQLGLGQRGVVDAALPTPSPPTVFSSLGNLPVFVFVCLWIIALVGLAKAKPAKVV